MSLRTGNRKVSNWAIVICALLATSALILVFPLNNGTKLHFKPGVVRQSFVESGTFDELRENAALRLKPLTNSMKEYLLNSESNVQ